MNRRKFLSWIGLGAATITVSPTLLQTVEAPIEFELMQMPALPAEMAAWYSTIDSIIECAASELGYRAGLSVAALYK